jgi:hypothetical protein
MPERRSAQRKAVHVSGTDKSNRTTAKRPLTEAQFKELLRSGMDSSRQMRKVPTVGDLMRGLREIAGSR